MDITYNLQEFGVRSTTLRARASYLRHEVSQSFFDAMPKSHKKYTFTIKENRTSMRRYLEATPNYYHLIMRHLFHNYPQLRTAIWFEELDSKGIRHIHGVISSPKHIYFSKMQLYGLQFYGKKMSVKVQPLQDVDEILQGRREQFATVKTGTKWKNPEHWEKYILKGKKTEMFLILRV